MKGQFWRKALAAALALLIVSGGVPVKPFTEIFSPAAITAEAESGNSGILADFIGNYTDKPIPIKNEVIVDRDITLSGNQNLVLQDDTELIVEKGCTLTLDKNDRFIKGNNYNLTISGGGTITGNTVAGIVQVSDLVINIGVCNLGKCGINAISANNITINGGSITVRGMSPFIAKENIYLNGGIIDSTKCSAGGHIYVKGNEVDASYVTNGVLDLRNRYTVTWKNYDGTALKTDTAKDGDTPYYSGATPTKPGNAQYSYTFSGWSPAVSAVTSDTTYTAQFSETVNKYNITLPENMEFVPASETSGFEYNSTVSFKAKDGYTASNVKANGTDLTADENGVYTVTVEGDVTVSAEFEKAQEPVTYIDENGVEQTVADYTVLTGTETTLEAGWYVVNSNISYDHTLNINGNVSLILSDGYTMAVAPTGYGDGICDSKRTCSLDVYGQSSGTGKLSITTTGESWLNFGSCIYMEERYTQHSGTVEMTTSGVAAGGITARYVSINGGTVNTNIGASYTKGINGGISLVINGGKITANATGEESNGIGCDVGGTIVLVLQL